MSTDAIAYINGTSFYCYSCGTSAMKEYDNEEFMPMFWWDETDRPIYCAECEALIPLALTPEGREYVARLDEESEEET